MEATCGESGNLKMTRRMAIQGTRAISPPLGSRNSGVDVKFCHVTSPMSQKEGDQKADTDAGTDAGTDADMMTRFELSEAQPRE